MKNSKTETEKRRSFSQQVQHVIALSWGSTGILIGGSLADLQVQRLGLSSYTFHANAFYISSIIVAVDKAFFAIKVASRKQDK